MKKVAILSAVFALALAACGRSDSPEESVTFLIDWDPEPTYLGVYYAEAAGFFDEAGYDVDIVSLRGANAVIQAVSNGGSVIGTASGGATVIGAANGNRTVSTAVIYPEISTVVYGYAAEGVREPADLAGKQIAIYPTSITKDEFEAFVRLTGLEEGSFTVVDAVGSDLEFLAQGQADAVLNYAEMSPARLASDPDAERVDGQASFELYLADYGVAGYGLNIVASPGEYDADREKIDALTAAAVEGYRRGCENREAAVQSFLEAVHRSQTRIEQERGYVTLSWDRICDRLIGQPIGEQTASGWRTTIETYDSLGLLPNPVTPADVMPR